MAFSRISRTLCIFALLLTSAHGQEIEDANCERVKAAINKQNEQPSYRLVVTYTKGVAEVIQLKDLSYRRWNGGPWSARRRIVSPVRHGDVDLLRSCRVIDVDASGSNGTRTYLRYERHEGGRVIEFHMWLDGRTGLPASTTGVMKLLNGKTSSWVSTFSYDRDLSAPI